MLNKNYKISKKKCQYVEKLNPMYTSLDNVNSYYKNIINEKILSLLPHKEQAKVLVTNCGKDIEVIVKLPVLIPVHSEQTYYLTEGVLEYVISRDEIVYQNGSVVRLNRMSAKPYKIKTVLRFHGYYNDYINR